ncbi:hypothetical protein SBA2_980001 [Acidobacteriia bacterium SbA2]|nr:hypothetical protein SBA2_980001 [Acidobacteriia bacterium SbA2]
MSTYLKNLNLGKKGGSARQENGDWRLEFPGSEPGKVGWHFLESVAAQVKKVLRADAGDIPRLSGKGTEG